MCRLLNLRQLDGETVRGEEEDKETKKELSASNDPAPLGNVKYSNTSITCLHFYIVLEAITLKIHERTQLRLQEVHVCVCVRVRVCVYISLVSFVFR